MITVRFPTGFSIQYNDAHYTFRESTQTLLYDSSNKAKLFAIVPNDCVIEHRTPCRMYQCVPAESDAVLALAKEIRLLKRKLGVKK